LSDRGACRLGLCRRRCRPCPGPAGAFKALGINHVGYLCPGILPRARDFYTSVLGMQNAPGREAQKPERAVHVRPRARQGRPVHRHPQFHQCAAAIPDRGRSRLLHDCQLGRSTRFAALSRRKAIEPGGREGSINLLDPFNYYVQLASAGGRKKRIQALRGARPWKDLLHRKLNDYATGKMSPPRLDRNAHARRNHGLCGQCQSSAKAGVKGRA